MVHDESKDKEFELEVTWISPQSNNRHASVPKELKEEAERLAKAALDDGMEED
jgi:20S proteasome subunit alpha 7